MQVLKIGVGKSLFAWLFDQRTYNRGDTGPASRQWRSGCDRRPHRLGRTREGIARAVLTSGPDGHRPAQPNGDARD